MGTLGVTELVLGHYPDGETEKHKKHIRRFLAKIITSFQPDIVITLEPDGVYGHPDHIAVSAIVADVVSGGKLMYATVDEHFTPSRGASAMAKKRVSPLSPTMRLVLTEKETAKKLQAFREHKSQFIVNNTFITKWRNMHLLQNEFFYIS